MFKGFSFKKKAKPDMRFVDAEEYRSLRAPNKYTSLSSQRNQNNGVEPRSNLFANIDQPSVHAPSAKPSLYRDRSGRPLLDYEHKDEFIRVDSFSDLLPEDIEIPNVPAKMVPKPTVSEKLPTDVKKGSNDRANNRSHLLEVCKNSLGIFSDSKAYSALIKQELNAYQIAIRHFNHPSTFKENRYEFFDQISAWILFLSDDCDEEFIDRFLDRYSDKPTLFICPKTSRLRTSDRINDFIKACRLEDKIDSTEDLTEIS